MIFDISLAISSIVALISSVIYRQSIWSKERFSFAEWDLSLNTEVFI